MQFSPLSFFGMASPIMGAFLTLVILAAAAVEFATLWTDDRRAAWLIAPLLAWSLFAGSYVGPAQALINPDPLLDIPALLR